MPQTGGAINRPPKVTPKKLTVKEQKADTVMHGTGQTTQGSTGGKPAVVKNYNTTKMGGFTEEQNEPALSAKELAAKLEAQHQKSVEKHQAAREANADRFGFDFKTTPVARSGGTAPRDTGGFPRTSPVTRDGGGMIGPPHVSDPDLVGSEGHITNFDGSQDDWGSSNEVDYGEGGEAGGGGTGSSLAGRGSVGEVGQLEGHSMEEIVYGVRKKGKKSSIRRGLGE